MYYNRTSLAKERFARLVLFLMIQLLISSNNISIFEFLSVLFCNMNTIPSSAFCHFTKYYSLWISTIFVLGLSLFLLFTTVTTDCATDKKACPITLSTFVAAG